MVKFEFYKFIYKVVILSDQKSFIIQNQQKNNLKILNIKLKIYFHHSNSVLIYSKTKLE